MNYELSYLVPAPLQKETDVGGNTKAIDPEVVR
jgi:hypothetical protein